MKKFVKFLIIMMCIGMLGIVTVIYSPQKYVLYPKRYHEYVSKYAEAYGVEENLIYAVMKAESRFYPYATSSKGAMGLMQVTEGTLDWISEKIDLRIQDPYDIEKNIQAGTWYLSTLQNTFDDIDLIIIAYNAGPGKTKEWMQEGILVLGQSNSSNLPYRETQQYIEKVKKYYTEYNKYYR